MLATPVVVTVTVDGSIVASSVEATLVDGTVVAPMSPFLDALALRYSLNGGILVIEGRGRRVTLVLGVRRVSVEDLGRRHDRSLPRAAALLGDEVVVPLAAVARALGYVARYESSRVLAIERGPASPLENEAPEALPSGPYETFAPRTVATPARPLASIVPQPRRTPIHEVDGPVPRATASVP